MEKVITCKLEVTPTQTVNMPLGAQLLSVQAVSESPTLFIQADDGAGTEDRIFLTFRAGEELPDPNTIIYIGTYQIYGGQYIGHVYEQV